MGWRQADTMAIARNFLERPSGLLWPRIDWGGAGPGFVESELQLLPYLIAALNRWFGQVEWTGQLLSLLLMTGTGAVLLTFLRGRFGRGPAVLGLSAWLANQGVVFASTSVQPDILSLLLSLVAICAFVNYLDHGRAMDLLVTGAATALAALVKPTALQIGVVEFLLVAFTRPRLLRNAGLWIMWGFVLASVGLLLWHGRQLYLTYGNTFGILSGGDRKTPRLEQLIHPRLYLHTAAISLTWGIGWLGAAAGAWLLVRRRLQSIEWAFLIGTAVLILVSLRYTSNINYGSHYHLPTTIVGAFLVTHAAAELSARARSLLVTTCVAVLSAILCMHSVRNHRTMLAQGKRDAAVKIGHVLAQTIAPGDLVVVRGLQDAWESWWNTHNNFEDPRTLYVAHARGWVLAADDSAEGSLKRMIEQGARWYVEFGPLTLRADFDRELAHRGELAFSDESRGRIWRLGK
jgi:hypothetical protein